MARRKIQTRCTDCNKKMDARTCCLDPATRSGLTARRRFSFDQTFNRILYFANVVSMLEAVSRAFVTMSLSATPYSALPHMVKRGSISAAKPSIV